ncbi:unnamed protein product, partial [Pelagomonas calceolata]
MAAPPTSVLKEVLGLGLLSRLASDSRSEGMVEYEVIVLFFALSRVASEARECF